MAAETKKAFLKAGFVLPFMLITTCLAMWGFANDITNPMVKAFSKIFRMSVTQGALVQVAFYGGYFCMAFPASLFIRKFSYKSGVLVGLGLYAIGALLFLPAKNVGVYGFFLLAYFIMTCGLSFLETSCNPYILSMGPEDTATRRLNFAQCFNPIGSLVGMYVAMNFIQARLNPASSAERSLLSGPQFDAMKQADLSVLTAPYLAIGLVIVAMFILILITRMPKDGDSDHSLGIGPTLGRLLHNSKYVEGVISQFFYVGVQIMCWTFIIQYGTRVFMAEGMPEGCGSSVPAVQYSGDGHFRNLPIHLHVPDEICQAFQDADYLRDRRNAQHNRRNILSEQAWTLLSRGYERIHVSDVPDNLRNCPGRLGR